MRPLALRRGWYYHVLPRFRDAVKDAMILYESKEKDEVVRLMSLEFNDAFKQLPVDS